MTTITIKLPDGLRERVEMEARQRGLSRSAVVRLALERLLSEASDEGERSCYELMKDAAGMVKEAPPDLSDNKNHLAGFGR